MEWNQFHCKWVGILKGRNLSLFIGSSVFGNLTVLFPHKNILLYITQVTEKWIPMWGQLFFLCLSTQIRFLTIHKNCETNWLREQGQIGGKIGSMRWNSGGNESSSYFYQNKWKICATVTVNEQNIFDKCLGHSI